MLSMIRTVDDPDLHVAADAGMMHGMRMKTEHLRLGGIGEETAARFLESRGFRIVARNWRPPNAKGRLELDLVARHKEWLVFVEVKTRTIGGLNIPAHTAFTSGKQTKVTRAARMYLAAHSLWHMPCRFDLVCIAHAPGRAGECMGEGAFVYGDMILEYYEHVIELGQTVDRGHAAWQPW
jgi:putative endonuclease